MWTYCSYCAVYNYVAVDSMLNHVLPVIYVFNTQTPEYLSNICSI